MSGSVMHTQNGGSTWRSQTSGTGADLWYVGFPTDTSGWAVGESGAILHTEDAGATWDEQSSGSTHTSIL